MMAKHISLLSNLINFLTRSKSQWTEMFENNTLVAVLVDRLTFS